MLRRWLLLVSLRQPAQPKRSLLHAHNVISGSSGFRDCERVAKRRNYFFEITVFISLEEIFRLRSR